MQSFGSWRGMVGYRDGGCRNRVFDLELGLVLMLMLVSALVRLAMGGSYLWSFLICQCFL